MKITYKLLRNFLVTTILCCVGLATQAAGIKCWTNNEGVRECGTTVPPEFAQQEHEEINRQGRVVNEQERVKTEEELAAEKKQVAAELEKQQVVEERARKDKILLDVYTKVEDIEKVRDDNIRAIQARITLAKSHIDKTQVDLDKRIQSAAEVERGGKTPNEAMLKDIEDLKQRIKNNEDFIAEREKEIENIRANYAADIERFKELKKL
ncbi:MAG: hypothetical protein HW386_122 [Gammaproteobacteria bacterium]|nr:hypothetical protein [Gammaproteobacteria bacterium]